MFSAERLRWVQQRFCGVGGRILLRRLCAAGITCPVHREIGKWFYQELSGELDFVSH